MLLNCSNRNLDKLQRVQDNLASVVCNSSRLTPAEPLLRSLHWLPVRQRINNKLANLCYLAVSRHQLVYLAHLIRPYSQSRLLRSSTLSLLSVPRTTSTLLLSARIRGKAVQGIVVVGYERRRCEYGGAASADGLGLRRGVPSHQGGFEEGTVPHSRIFSILDLKIAGFCAF